MKKSLEDIVEENRSLFDDLEPYEGHFERFRKKLNTKAQKDIKRIVFLESTLEIYRKEVKA